MKKVKQYAIYDEYDNYIYGGSKQDLARYLNRTLEGMNCFLCRYFKGQINHIIVNGKYCKLYKIED